MQYVYGLNGLLYGEYTNAGVLIREYVYLNDAPLAQIDAGTPEVLTYLHPDHLGTPRYGTNTGGTQVWAANTDAFGVGTPSGSATVNLRMPGQYYDSESGLFYNWNRYYSPAIGRYISSDPIGLKGGLNTFNYANVSPLMYTDPTGEAVPVAVGFAVCMANPACSSALLFAGGATIYAISTVAEGIFDVIGSIFTGIGSIFNSDQGDSCNDCMKRPPTGSRPIDQTDWSGDHQEIKRGIGAGPKDKVYISPGGNVIGQNPDGTYSDHGPAGGYTESGESSGRRGKDRERR